MSRGPKAVVKCLGPNRYQWYLRSAQNYVLYVSPEFPSKELCKDDRAKHIDAARRAEYLTEGE